MFFFFSKVFDLFASPFVWSLIFAAIAAWCARPARLRRRPAGPRTPWLTFAAAVAAVVVVYPFSMAPVANSLVRGLESSAVSTAKPGEVYDAVIVLGGVLDTEATESSGVPSYNGAIERLLTTFDVLRTGQARFVLISGGATNPRAGDPEARVLSRQLEAWGIAPERIVSEDKSRNTHENAVFSARIVRERGWGKLLLVTSAFHVDRAVGCFRAEGLNPDVLPVDFRGYAPSRFSGSLLPRTTALDDSTLSLHEYVGRAVYRLRGYAK